MNARMLVTDHECLQCYGTGRASAPEPCYHCLGIGRELTPLGKELLSVLDEWFGLKPKPEDV